MSSLPSTIQRPATGLTERQIQLVKNTIAADCNRDEFDLFVQVARNTGLDPFRKQIIPLVFNKNNADKRRMSIVVTQDGQRVLAQRCGNYRPESGPPQFETDETLKGPTNPAGLVLCRVQLWQQDNRGDWYPVYGEAYWEEFAPIVEQWAYDEQAGKRKPTGKTALDKSGNWARQPRLMLHKCARMQALRAGWPDVFGNLYVEEELHATMADITASEALEKVEEEDRLRRVGGKDALVVLWGAGSTLEQVPLGQFHDRAVAWLREKDRTAEDIEHWRETNRVTLREFWAREPGDALDLNREIEQRVEALHTEEDDGQQTLEIMEEQAS